MDEVIAALVPKDKEVSLKTLKKKEIDKIMAAVKRGKDVAENYYRDTMEPKVLERENIYFADKKYYKGKFPKLSEKCEWRSLDVKTAVDGIVPSLMEVFTGADNPVDVTGRQVDDDLKARKTGQLLKYYLETKNDYTTTNNDVIRAGLALNWGVVKAYWKRVEERKHYQVMISPDDFADMAYIVQNVTAGTMEVTKIKEVEGGYYNIEFDDVRIKDNYPVLEPLSPSELIYSPEASEIEECKFVAHRKIVHGDYLKRKEKEGIYEDVDKAMEAATEPRFTTYDTTHNKELSNNKNAASDNDTASKLFELFECYVNVDFNNDGIYEKLIVHTIGDSGIPIKIQTNDFDRVPFFIQEAERDPAVIFNEKSGFPDIIEQQQDLKTAVIRQMIINIAKANDPKIGFDETKVDVDAMLSDSAYVPVRNTDPSRAFFPFPSPTLSPNSMDLVQYSQNEIESQTGFTRYNQGLDSSSLNKTATGITAIMGMAEKRQKNLAKIYAERFYKPLFRFIIQMAQKYAEEEVMIRVGDENVSISKDDLDVDYDLIINVGQGAGTKEARIQYLMILLQQIYPSMLQQGIVDANAFYTATKLLLDEMGLLSAEKTLIDPSSQQYKQMQAAAQQMAMQTQQMAQEAELQNKIAQINAKAAADIQKAKVPKVSVGMEDLPPDAQVQVMGNMGLATTPEGMVIKEALKHGQPREGPPDGTGSQGRTSR